MDYRYLQSRLDAFRREYFETSGRWLRRRGSWLWHFTIDNFRYLYLGEIHQIGILGQSLRQQREYIDFIHSRPYGGPVHGRPEPPGPRGLRPLRHYINLMLLPVAFVFHWLRRLIRLVHGRRYGMAVSPFFPTEDRAPQPDFSGQATTLFLIPSSGKHYPRGLTLLRYRLTGECQQLRPVLMIDPGMGFVSEYTITLPCRADQSEQELLIELPPLTKLLVLRVADQPCRIELSDVSMQELGLAAAYRYLGRRYGYPASARLHALFIKKMPGVRRIRNHRCSYPVWYRRFHELDDTDRMAIQHHIAALDAPPLVSIMVQTRNAEPAWLDLTIKSVVQQLYPHWELLIACQEQPDAHVTAILNAYERHESRVHLIIDPQRAGLSDDPVQVLAACRGSHVLLLEQGDLLTEHALYLIATHCLDHPAQQVIYADHDHIDRHGHRHTPCFKPDWNPELLLGRDYLRYAACYQVALLRELAEQNRFRLWTGLPSLHLDLFSRFAIIPPGHLPWILLHRRMEHDIDKPVTETESLHDPDVLQHCLDDAMPGTRAERTRGGYRIVHPLPTPAPLVSLIVLTRDRVALVSHCVQGLLERTDYPNLEVILVDNGSTEEATLVWLDAIARHERVTVLRRPEPFNFSKLNNEAITHARGEYIGLINNDIAVIEGGWLEEMMGHLVRPGVGVVGAKLLYEDQTIQHAGVIIGLGGVAGHAFRHEPRQARGYDDRLLLTQQLSCVTAACLLTRKSIYESVGGMDETNLKIAFNDVDYCLKVREAGHRIVWTPFAELYHLESASRGSDLSKENIDRWNAEFSFMRHKWREKLEYDPAYNPNLTIADEEYGLASPPRLLPPWERYRSLR